jgi:hypothetical protein
MIGTRKLADIKKELREKLGKDKKRVQNWVARKEAGLSAGESQNARVLEELLWVRKLLRDMVEEESVRPKRLRKRKAKKEAAT